MIIEPIIDGIIARSAHPDGCQIAIQEQINTVKKATQINTSPKRVLILGASSGFGLAARIALTFGGANADTIGVSFERAPKEDKPGSAGWYNNIFFKQEAEKENHIAVNINGDAFSQTTKDQVIEAIETYFEGEVDLIIYSIASGVKPKPNYAPSANPKINKENMWRSCIKPIGQPVDGVQIMLEDDSWHTITLPAANESEIESTIAVMGGVDWEDWIDTLINTESIAPGCQTFAFSYIGSKATFPIYRDGTLGAAKVDLHQTSHALNLKLANYDGSAHISVCKALVTKASVFIPGLMPYLSALNQVLKENHLHEEAIDQMQRLFRDKVFHGKTIPVDKERLIRMDDWELQPEIQQQVLSLLQTMNQDNFKEISDYQGIKKTFLQLNGFEFDGVDYQKPVDLKEFYQKYQS